MINFKMRGRIADVIKKTRLSMGEEYTQEYMAEKLGLKNRQSYAKIENGDGNISFKHISKLLEMFECDIGYLMGEYPTKRRVASDIQNETGLSEKAIEALFKFKTLISKTVMNVDTVPFSTTPKPFDGKYYKDNLEAMTLMLENDEDSEVISNIARYLYSDFININAVERTTGISESMNAEEISDMYINRIIQGLKKLKEKVNSTKATEQNPFL